MGMPGESTCRLGYCLSAECARRLPTNRAGLATVVLPILDADLMDLRQSVCDEITFGLLSEVREVRSTSH
jgi:hypothetical protein